MCACCVARANGDAQARTVVQPDSSIVCALARLDRRGCVGAPDLIIKIVLPSSLVLDTRMKFYLYAESGVRETGLPAPTNKSSWPAGWKTDSHSRSRVSARAAAGESLECKRRVLLKVCTKGEDLTRQMVSFSLRFGFFLFAVTPDGCPQSCYFVREWPNRLQNP